MSHDYLSYLSAAGKFLGTVVSTNLRRLYAAGLRLSGITALLALGECLASLSCRAHTNPGQATPAVTAIMTESMPSSFTRYACGFETITVFEREFVANETAVW